MTETKKNSRDCSEGQGARDPPQTGPQRKVRLQRRVRHQRREVASRHLQGA